MLLTLSIDISVSHQPVDEVDIVNSRKTREGENGCVNGREIKTTERGKNGGDKN